MPCFKKKKLEAHYYVHNSLPLDPILTNCAILFEDL